MKGPALFYGEIITKKRKFIHIFFLNFTPEVPEPQGQFQPNLVQRILGWMRFNDNDHANDFILINWHDYSIHTILQFILFYKFVQMKDPALF